MLEKFYQMRSGSIYRSTLRQNWESFEVGMENLAGRLLEDWTLISDALLKNHQPKDESKTIRDILEAENVWMRAKRFDTLESKTKFKPSRHALDAEKYGVNDDGSGIIRYPFWLRKDESETRQSIIVEVEHMRDRMEEEAARNRKRMVRYLFPSEDGVSEPRTVVSCLWVGSWKASNSPIEWVGLVRREEDMRLCRYWKGAPEQVRQAWAAEGEFEEGRLEGLIKSLGYWTEGNQCPGSSPY
jgi:hypothetical protein